MQNQDVEEEKDDQYAPADTGGNRSADTPTGIRQNNLDYNRTREDPMRGSNASYQDVNRFV